MAAVSDYSTLAASYSSLPAFSPLLSASTLPSLAYIFLPLAFLLSFYFSTLKRSTGKELAVGGAAAVAASVGLCSAFCSFGLNV